MVIMAAFLVWPLVDAWWFQSKRLSQINHHDKALSLNFISYETNGLSSHAEWLFESPVLKFPLLIEAEINSRWPINAVPIDVQISLGDESKLVLGEGRLLSHDLDNLSLLIENDAFKLSLQGDQEKIEIRLFSANERVLPVKGFEQYKSLAVNYQKNAEVNRTHIGAEYAAITDRFAVDMMAIQWNDQSIKVSAKNINGLHDDINYGQFYWAGKIRSEAGSKTEYLNNELLLATELGKVKATGSLSMQNLSLLTLDMSVVAQPLVIERLIEQGMRDYLGRTYTDKNRDQVLWQVAIDEQALLQTRKLMLLLSRIDWISRERELAKTHLYFANQQWQINDNPVDWKNVLERTNERLD